MRRYSRIIFLGFCLRHLPRPQNYIHIHLITGQILLRFALFSQNQPKLYNKKFVLVNLRGLANCNPRNLSGREQKKSDDATAELRYAVLEIRKLSRAEPNSKQRMAYSAQTTRFWGVGLRDKVFTISHAVPNMHNTKKKVQKTRKFSKLIFYDFFLWKT
jgi:hypothetical protein